MKYTPPTKEEALELITDLVNRFENQIEDYKQAAYNETKTRRDFLDAFFSALGWDMDNKEGYTEAYREVIHEDRVKIDGATKAPDYAFRLVGGTRLFFVEAKKPSVHLSDKISPAYQVRRYAWNAKLPISILTDFEEFAIYDCTKKPKPDDKPSVARVKHFTYKDYIKEFDFIWDTFGKENVPKGSIDKFVKSNTDKKGTTTVDKEFLESLDKWRTYLATNISWNNKNLDEDEINFAVQQTIDRIIFLRIAEDRKVEPYGNLRHAIKQGDFYKNLFGIFQHADEKYNSGLFDFAKDKTSKNLVIDNKVIKSIVTDLYYPESPYEFSVLSVEILGSAYEQFLGKVIRLTPAHQAKIEEKPEVRKAGGVYYTPQYIVEYIVKNTVGKLIEGKKPKDIEKIKIVDPACGSGSFLLGAYQYLLDYHKNYYTNNGKVSKGGKNNPLTPDGHLNTSEKKKILINNIFGVDIDLNAVEVTKLSLLLKCMEGETEASIATQMQIWHERVLPSLEHNIKSGNSLVDTDYYNNELDFGEEKKVKPFNWRKAFPDVFKKVTERKADISFPALGIYETQIISRKVEEPITIYNESYGGGFDCVIGNPPYGFMIPLEQQKYFEIKYKNQDYQKDLYLLFLERYQDILKEKGKLGVIISNTWLQSLTIRKIRSYLLNNYSWDKVLLLPEKVFSAVVDTVVIVFEKGKPSKKNQFEVEILKDFKVYPKHSLIQSEISSDGEPINVSVASNVKDIFEKINKHNKLSNVSKVYNGVKPFEKGKGTPPQTQKIVDEKPFVFEGNMPNNKWSPLLRGSLIRRYSNLWKQNYWILYGVWLAAARDSSIFSAKEKIMIRQTGDSLIATIIPEGFIARNNLHIIIPNQASEMKYLLGLINSKMMDFVYSYINPEKGEALAEVKKQHVEMLPIKEVNMKNKSEVDLYNEIVKLVDQLLKLNEEKAEAKLQTKVDQLESKIDYCESRINEIVYQLYELTTDEIKTIENN